MFYPGLASHSDPARSPPSSLTMLTAATNKAAVDSITTISSSTRSAVPHTLGPPTPTRTFATTLNSSGADEIMIHDDIMLTVATNTVIPTVPTVRARFTIRPRCAARTTSTLPHSTKGIITFMIAAAPTRS